MLSEADFRRLNGPETRNVSVWRALPNPRARLVRQYTAREHVIASSQLAAPTLLAAGASKGGTARLVAARFRLDLFGELRAERKGRAGSVVDQDAARYAQFSDPAIAAIPAGAPSGMGPSPVSRESFVGHSPPRRRDLRRRRGLYRVEDQPPRRHRLRAFPVAAPPSVAGRDQPAAAAPEIWGDPLVPPDKAPATAEASAATVKGLRSRPCPTRSSLSPLPT